MLDRALFAQLYKNEGTMCHVMCSVSTLVKISVDDILFFLFFPENRI